MPGYLPFVQLTFYNFSNGTKLVLEKKYIIYIVYMGLQRTIGEPESRYVSTLQSVVITVTDL